MSVDAKSGEVRVLDTGLAPLLAQRVLSMPVVPPHAVAALAARWAEIAPGLPAPRLPRIEDRGPVAPIPVLTLCQEKVELFSAMRRGWNSAGTVKN